MFSKQDIELGSILFFLNGFDTTSTPLCVIMHALLHHPEVQETLRAEIDDVLGDDNEEVTADHLRDMKYMDNVISESQRKYFTLGKLSHKIHKL